MLNSKEACTMKKAVIALTVCMALWFSLGVYVKDAIADAILFPWIVRSADVTTVVSVVNTAETDAEALGLPFHNNRIHIEYWHKLTTANDQEETCTEYDYEVTSSKDDMVTWDIAGKFNGGLPMFNDESNEVIGVPDMKLAVADPRRGFLLVDNNTEALINSSCEGDFNPNGYWQDGPGCNVDGTMYGEATILEHKTGAAWGYIAYNASYGQTNPLEGEFRLSFENGLDQQGEAICFCETTQTTLINPNEAMTKLFVTPIGTAEIGQRTGNLNVITQLCRYPERNTGQRPPEYIHTGDCTGGGIWNNEEGGFSFTTKKNIVCTSADNIVDFFGGAGSAAYNQWVSSGKAGWAYIVTQTGNIDDRDGTDKFEETGEMVIGKLEFGTGLNWGGSIADTINNFVWLRDNTDLLIGCQYVPIGFCEPMGINIIHNQYVTFDELGACCTNPPQGQPDTCLDLSESSCNSIPNSTWNEGLDCDSVNCNS
jgi:hypothetical protein